LYDQVAEWVDAMEASSLWDLYCGVGGFALHCARPGGHDADDRDHRVRRVTSVEVSEQAIESAKISAAELGLEAQFLAADATEFAEVGLNVDVTGRERPDCAIVNPRRRGIGTRLAAALEGSEVENIVFSTCNPSSLAKDLARMPGDEVAQAVIFYIF